MDRDEEWVREQWSDSHGLSLDEEIEWKLSSGKNPALIATEMAQELGAVEREVIDAQPDIGHSESLSPGDVEGIIFGIAARMSELTASADSGSGADYMPTQDVADPIPSFGEEPNPDDAGPYNINRGQTQANLLPKTWLIRK